MMEWMATWPEEQQEGCSELINNIRGEIEQHCEDLALRLTEREEKMKRERPGAYANRIVRIQRTMLRYHMARANDAAQDSSRAASPMSLASIHIRDSDTEYQQSSPARPSTPISPPRVSTPVLPSKSSRSSVEPRSSPIISAQQRRVPPPPQIIPAPATPQRFPSPATPQRFPSPATHQRFPQPATPQLFPPTATSRPNSRLGGPSKPSPLTPTGFIRSAEILSRPGTPQPPAASLLPVPAKDTAVGIPRRTTPQPPVASGSNVVLLVEDNEDAIPSRIPRRARKTRVPSRMPHTMASIEARTKKGAVEPTGEITPMGDLEAADEAEPPAKRAPKRAARGGSTKVVNKGKK